MKKGANKGYRCYNDGGLVRDDSAYMRYRASDNVEDRRDMSDPIGRKLKELDQETAFSKDVSPLDGRRDVREQALTPRDPLARLNNQGKTDGWQPSKGRLKSAAIARAEQARRGQPTPTTISRDRYTLDDAGELVVERGSKMGKPTPRSDR